VVSLDERRRVEVGLTFARTMRAAI
jgi:hypothetical protein